MAESLEASTVLNKEIFNSWVSGGVGLHPKAAFSERVYVTERGLCIAKPRGILGGT